MYMHLSGMGKTPIPTLPCVCATLRRAARALSQHYEEALRPFGLSGSQFTILQVLSLAGEQNQGDLGQMLVMDSTTLSRTLAIMNRHGWIARRRGKDKRERRFHLSRSGDAVLARALPSWQQAQEDVHRQFGKHRSDEFMNFANSITHSFSKGGSV